MKSAIGAQRPARQTDRTRVVLLAALLLASPPAWAGPADASAHLLPAAAVMALHGLALAGAELLNARSVQLELRLAFLEAAARNGEPPVQAVQLQGLVEMTCDADGHVTHVEWITGDERFQS